MYPNYSDQTTPAQLPSPERTHAASWRVSRRVADWMFRWAVPGKHHSFDGTLIALMTSREMGA